MSARMSAMRAAPGASVGTFHTGNVTFSSGTFAVELGGAGAGQFDVLDVNGSVTLGCWLTTSRKSGDRPGITLTSKGPPRPHLTGEESR